MKFVHLDISHLVKQKKTFTVSNSTINEHFYSLQVFCPMCIIQRCVVFELIAVWSCDFATCEHYSVFMISYLQYSHPYFQSHTKHIGQSQFHHSNHLSDIHNFPYVECLNVFFQTVRGLLLLCFSPASKQVFFAGLSYLYFYDMTQPFKMITDWLLWKFVVGTSSLPSC